MSPPLRWDQLALHMSNLAIVRKHEEGEQASKFKGYADYLLDNACAWSYLTCSSVASWRTSDIYCKQDLGFRILRTCSAVSGESIQSQNLQVLNPSELSSSGWDRACVAALQSNKDQYAKLWYTTTASVIEQNKTAWDSQKAQSAAFNKTLMCDYSCHARQPLVCWPLS